MHASDKMPFGGGVTIGGELLADAGGFAETEPQDIFGSSDPILGLGFILYGPSSNCCSGAAQVIVSSS